jgi:hypothetical protein
VFGPYWRWDSFSWSWPVFSPGERVRSSEALMPGVSRAIALMVLLGTHASRVLATDGSPEVVSQPVSDERFAVHGQITYVYQQTNDFNSPYRGPNSLSPSKAAETVDATLFLGARLWSGAEAWVTPEIDQGFGLDSTLGVAGFPSGAAYKVGANEPYFVYRGPSCARRSARAAVSKSESMGLPTSSAHRAASTAGCSRWVSSS